MRNRTMWALAGAFIGRWRSPRPTDDGLHHHHHPRRTRPPLYTSSITDSIAHSAGRAMISADRRATVRVVAGNKGATGPFAPIVRVTRDAMGTKEFNQLRGKAISLHSQVIKDFCKQIGVQTKQAQGLIRLAKKNGEWLGFLA